MSEPIFEPIKATDEEVLAAIRRKTAYALPDHPTAQGMKPEAIRRRLYAAMIDPEASVLAEMQRIVGEANAALAQVLEKAFHYEDDMKELLDNDAVREEVVKRAEAAADRVDAGLKADDLFIRYSAYPDGRDYKEKWARGLNYIGVAAGLYEPEDASGYVWSVFAPGIYVGCGDMPDYADVQIDPEGEMDEGGISERTHDFGSGNVVGSYGFRIIASNDNGDGTGTYTLDGYTEGYAVGDVYSLRINNCYDWRGEITAINGNVITVTNFVSDTLVDNPAEESDANTFRVTAKPTVGSVDIGVGAVAFGENNCALGYGSAAFGAGNVAGGKGSAVFGRNNRGGYSSFVAGQLNEGDAVNVFVAGLLNRVTAERSGAVGAMNEVSGVDAFAYGYKNIVSGQRAMAHGYQCEASGTNAEAGGALCRATNLNSFARGNGSEATGEHSVAIGEFCVASGKLSFAQGWYCEARASRSVAMGQHTVAASNFQCAVGKFNVVDEASKYAYIVGNGTSDTARSNALAIRWDGTMELGSVAITPAQLTKLLALI